MMKKKKLSGSLTLEAALILPLFLLSLFTVIMLMKLGVVHYQVQSSLAEMAEDLSVVHYVLQKESIEEVVDDIEQFLDEHEDNPITAPLKDSMNIMVGGLKSKSYGVLFRKYMNKETQQELGIKGLQFHTDSSTEQEMIILKVSYEVSLPSVANILSELVLSNQVVTRGWIGAEHYKSQEQESDKGDQDEIVYIFLSSKEIYHPASCPKLNIKVKQMTAKEAKSLGKKSCSFCGGKADIQGYVYATNKTYHSATCYHIKPKVKSVKLSQVKDRRPCRCSVIYK